ncbi:hypothetical protein [Algisphaera agarilytica]|uniref:Uncharacterized protein n=1 Tax=Algisphaera agarilytica TaxID=1385975 RepID=A0A7X0H5Y6_9BACT|nr:hypothetical protein [Algisphaera agarilytica]MBB6428409.1 hypothetical protein [Algisphaera agarilytica]
MNRDSPDFIVEIDGLKTEPQASSTPPSFQNRPWLSVKWRCCSVYSRVYRNRRGDAYEGRCPKCGSPVKAMIGPGGTNNRFFEAG